MENLLTYPEKTDVCLVCMPAANLRMPAMSLSLPKSCLTTAGIKSFVDYENMHFAKKIGGANCMGDALSIKILADNETAKH